jgi:hypothetical protein
MTQFLAPSARFLYSSPSEGGSPFSDKKMEGKEDGSHVDPQVSVPSSTPSSRPTLPCPALILLFLRSALTTTSTAQSIMWVPLGVDTTSPQVVT